jgi:hypothetical protein
MEDPEFDHFCEEQFRRFVDEKAQRRAWSSSTRPEPSHLELKFNTL